MQPYQCMKNSISGIILINTKVRPHEMHETNVTPRLRIYISNKRQQKTKKIRFQFKIQLNVAIPIKFTLSGRISPKITYGIGIAPQEAMKIIAEKEATGTKWNGSKLILVEVAK